MNTVHLSKGLSVLSKVEKMGVDLMSISPDNH